MIDFGEFLIYAAVFFGLYTAIFFLVTLFENRKTLRLGESKWYPVVTICIPCFNEETTIEKTLISLLKLDYQKENLEIIIVDDGSTDNTLHKAQKLAKRFSDRDIKVIHKENGGKHTCLNKALEMCRGEFFGALDADSFVDKKALRRIIKHFENKEVTCVTPSMKIYEPKGVLQRIQSIEYLLGIFLRKVFAQLGSIHVTPGPFSIYRVSFFKKHGKYHAAYNTEDIEVALRIQRHHGVIENAPDAYVYTMGPNTFYSLYRQRLRWYYGFLRNVREYHDLFGRKHGNLGLFILPSSIISVVLLISLLVYQLIEIGKTVVEYIQSAIAVKFDIFNMEWFNFDWFFFNTSPTATVALFAFIFAFSVIVIAKNLANEKRIGFSYLLFILCYSFLYAFWWIMSIWAILFKRKGVRWGHKTNKI